MKQELLTKIDGKMVELSSGTKTLHTESAICERTEDECLWKRYWISSAIPILLTSYCCWDCMGSCLSYIVPGAILPGIVGVIALILAFYSMHTLPINYAGLALIIFAVILFLLEIKIVSHGLLAIGGVISLLLGSMMLIRSDSSLEMVKISRGVIIGATIVSAPFLFVCCRVWHQGTTPQSGNRY